MRAINDKRTRYQYPGWFIANILIHCSKIIKNMRVAVKISLFFYVLFSYKTYHFSKEELRNVLQFQKNGFKGAYRDEHIKGLW